MRGKATLPWTEGTRDWNYCKHVARIKEGLRARLGPRRDDLYTNISKGDGNKGDRRGKGQGPSFWALWASGQPSMNTMRNGGEKNHVMARWCITKILCFILIYSGRHQCSRKQVMACAARGHGRGRRGPTTNKDKGPSTSETRKGRKSTENLITEAV